MCNDERKGPSRLKGQLAAQTARMEVLCRRTSPVCMVKKPGLKGQLAAGQLETKFGFLGNWRLNIADHRTMAYNGRLRLKGQLAARQLSKWISL